MSRAETMRALQRSTGNRALQRVSRGDRATSGVSSLGLRATFPALRAPARAQRATNFSVGALNVAFDFDGLPATRPEMITAFRMLFLAEIAGEPQWNAVELNWLGPMTTAQVQWFLCATKVLSDTDHGGDVDTWKSMRPLALSASSPAPADREAFGRFVLTKSGWFERELPKTLPALSIGAVEAVEPRYERPADVDTGVIPALDQKRFDQRFSPDLILLLDAHDPVHSTSVELPVEPAKGVADVIQSEALAFFAPYAPSAQKGIAVSDFRYSTRIYDLGAVAINDTLRKNYMRNRAEQLPLLDQVHFSGTRLGDRAAMEWHLESLVQNSSIAEMVDRHLRVTARASHGGAVGLTSTFQKLAASEDQAKRLAHWNRLHTLCHELIHVMCHPAMEAKAETVSFGQVIKEGFTEVLGAQLSRAILEKAGASVPFRSRIDGGIDLGEIPAVDTVTEGYGDAAVRAKAILARVGDDRFRAAYFLGAVEKVGL